MSPLWSTTLLTAIGSSSGSALVGGEVGLDVRGTEAQSAVDDDPAQLAAPHGAIEAVRRAPAGEEDSEPVGDLDDREQAFRLGTRRQLLEHPPIVGVELVDQAEVPLDRE